MPFSEGELRSNRTLIIGRTILQKFNKIWYLSQCLFFIWFCHWTVLHCLQSRFHIWITFVCIYARIDLCFSTIKNKRSYPVSDQRAYTYCYWRDSAEAHWQTFYLSVYNIVASNSLNWGSMQSLFELWTTSSGASLWSKRFVDSNPWISWT